MNLRILSPDKILFEGEANSVTLPGALGSFMILNHHAPIISTLVKGTVKVDSGSKEFEITNGIVEANHNHVNVLVKQSS